MYNSKTVFLVFFSVSKVVVVVVVASLNMFVDPVIFCNNLFLLPHFNLHHFIYMLLLIFKYSTNIPLSQSINIYCIYIKSLHYPFHVYM